MALYFVETNFQQSTSRSTGTESVNRSIFIYIMQPQAIGYYNGYFRWSTYSFMQIYALAF